MHPFFIYLIQVNIALALFYLLYTFVLKKDTFLRLKRLFFLSAIGFSLLYPLFAIPGLSTTWQNLFFGSPDLNGEVLVTFGEPGTGSVIETGERAIESIPWTKLLSIFYMGITFAFALRFLFQLGSIYRVRTKCSRQTIAGIPVYRLKNNITPFSFFRLIFIHSDKHSGSELEQILLHELTHAKQWHSVDIVLIELVCLFSWWNPFVWLLKREMTMNLEYLADKGVLREGVDTKEYQYHLLRLTYHESAVPIVNNFNVSRLKQRIMMMNKSKSPALRLVKYLFILPVCLLLVTSNSVYANQKPSSHTLEEGVLPEPPPEKVMDEVFVAVENKPEFPGGSQAMMKFLADNIRYPVIAQENGIQGRVVCSLVITKEGKISNVEVLLGVNPSLDAEVKRVIGSMPDWKPGTQRGNPVNVRAIMPVVFRLQGDGPQEQVLSEEDKESLAVREIELMNALDGTWIFDEIVVVAYGPSKSPVQEEDQQEQQEQQNIDETEVFVVVDEQAEFPGGLEAMMKFLGENVKYPVEAQKNGVEGRVICNFVIMKDGTITDVNVVRGIDSLLDAEAVRVIESMPKWKPGKHRGEEVNVRYTLPINFRLNKEETEKRPDTGNTK